MKAVMRAITLVYQFQFISLFCMLETHGFNYHILKTHLDGRLSRNNVNTVLNLVDEVSKTEDSSSLDFLGSAEEVEKLKQVVANRGEKPSVSNVRAGHESRRGSGVGDLLSTTLTLLGKAPKQDLRSLIRRYREKYHDEISLPELPLETADLDTHVNSALEVLWATSRGDWDNMMINVKLELQQLADESTKWMQISATAGIEISESRIRELIRKYGGPNAIPKLNSRKFEGKFLKGDYLAALIDILREQNGNDYAKVAKILERERESFRKKGFGGNQG